MSRTDGVSIVLVVWNQVGYAKLTVDFLLKNTPPTPFELVVVDNGSRSNVKEYFDSICDKAEINYIRNDENLGAIRGINQGIRAARYDYVAVIHTDVLILEKGWMEKVIYVMKNDPSIGIVGLAGRQEISKTGISNEATLKHCLQDDDLNDPMTEDIAEVVVIDGLCFIMSRAFIEKTNGLDEFYGYMHCYDLDISMQSIEAGFKNVVVRIPALHLANGGMTRKTREYKKIVKDDYGLLKKNYKIFAHKWRHMLPIKIS